MTIETMICDLLDRSDLEQTEREFLERCGARSPLHGWTAAERARIEEIAVNHEVAFA